MKEYFSPLRYPGGKAFLASEFEKIISAIGLTKPTYVEPYAGGAGAAIALLFSGKVEEIVINDYDKAIFSFWKSITEQSEAFIQRIISTPVDIDEWKKQKYIYTAKNGSILDLGFATFFLNRTNRSGILKAGPIGGKKQDGSYKMDARYNKDRLIARISKIAKYRDKIEVLNEEGIQLTKRYLKKKNTFIYLDPPYIKKGAMLYMDLYEEKNHKMLADLLNSNAKSNWVLTYEEMEKVRSLYPDRERKRLDLKYSVYSSLRVRQARELMIFSDTTSRAK